MTFTISPIDRGGNGATGNLCAKAVNNQFIYHRASWLIAFVESSVARKVIADTRE
jgi:hypothetical protein